MRVTLDKSLLNALNLNVKDSSPGEPCEEALRVPSETADNLKSFRSKDLNSQLSVKCFLRVLWLTFCFQKGY